MLTPEHRVNPEKKADGKIMGDMCLCLLSLVATNNELNSKSQELEV